VSTSTAPEDRSQCTPCRGTGKLQSGKGGTPHEVTCPWCEGTGRFEPGADAQTHPAES
jgi:DnaJ-class molecular chaperone